ncbi:hypothetical protein R1flu_001530 [Riccia fluitans]|uniref:SHSP domain-containing protein n=1 Tax=Riccia fluitans TaxID=41844 RepID=A0ABD1Y3P7_9MARC
MKQLEALKSDTLHLVERGRGTYHRNLAIPENVFTDGTTAKVENGLLTITIPKIVPQLPAPVGVQMEAVKPKLKMEY